MRIGEFFWAETARFAPRVIRSGPFRAGTSRCYVRTSDVLPDLI